MFKTRTFLYLLAVPLLAVVIACGGDKKDSSSSSSDSSGSGTGSSQSSGGSGSGSSSSSGDDRASSDSVSLENCKEYANLEKAATAAFTTTSNGQTKLDKGALDKLVKASPKEIRSDMQTIVDTLVGFFEVLDKTGLSGDPSKIDPAKIQAAQAELEKAATKMEDKKFVEASERVEAYFAKRCS